MRPMTSRFTQAWTWRLRSLRWVGTVRRSTRPRRLCACSQAHDHRREFRQTPRSSPQRITTSPCNSSAWGWVKQQCSRTAPPRRRRAKARREAYGRRCKTWIMQRASSRNPTYGQSGCLTIRAAGRALRALVVRKILWLAILAQASDSRQQ